MSWKIKLRKARRMKKLLRDKRNNSKGKLEILLGLESKKYGKIIGRIKKKT